MEYLLGHISFSRTHKGMKIDGTESELGISPPWNRNVWSVASAWHMSMMTGLLQLLCLLHTKKTCTYMHTYMYGYTYIDTYLYVLHVYMYMYMYIYTHIVLWITICIYKDSLSQFLNGSTDAVKEWFPDAETQTLPGKKTNTCFSLQAVCSSSGRRLHPSFKLGWSWRWCNLRSEWVNSLRWQWRSSDPPPPHTPLPPEQLVKALCLFSPPSFCLHWVIRRPVCCNSSCLRWPDPQGDAGMWSRHNTWTFSERAVPRRQLLRRKLAGAAARTGAPQWSSGGKDLNGI